MDAETVKKMDAEVLSDPRVLALIDKYIVIGLYTDDKTELPENEWITSTVDGNVKSTMGKKNLDLQITKFKSNGQPFFMPLDASGNQLAANGATYSSDIEKFIKFLEEGLANFEKSKK